MSVNERDRDREGGNNALNMHQAAMHERTVATVVNFYVLMAVVVECVYADQIKSLVNEYGGTTG